MGQWMDLGTRFWHPPQILQGRMTSSPTWQRRESLGSRSSNALPFWLECNLGALIHNGEVVMISRWANSCTKIHVIQFLPNGLYNRRPFVEIKIWIKLSVSPNARHLTSCQLLCRASSAVAETSHYLCTFSDPPEPSQPCFVYQRKTHGTIQWISSSQLRKGEKVRETWNYR